MKCHLNGLNSMSSMGGMGSLGSMSLGSKALGILENITCPLIFDEIKYRPS